MSWKQLNSRHVYGNPFFQAYEDDVVRPDGSPGKYYVLHPKNGVAVVAFDGEKLLMVNQYRYPLKKRIWSFVAGTAEEGITPLALAKKELKEETGFTAKRWNTLGTFPNSPSLSGQGSEVFLAQGLNPGNPEREPGEADMECKFYALEEIEFLIERGELGAYDIADFFLFKLYLAKIK